MPLALLAWLSADPASHRWRRLVGLAAGFLVTTALAVGVFDLLTWGRPFGSLVEFARYTLVERQASAEVIAQKLRQTGLPIGTRSVERVIAEYGLQKNSISAALALNHPGTWRHVPAGSVRSPRLVILLASSAAYVSFWLTRSLATWLVSGFWSPNICDWERGTCYVAGRDSQPNESNRGWLCNWFTKQQSALPGFARTARYTSVEDLNSPTDCLSSPRTRLSITCSPSVL